MAASIIDLGTTQMETNGQLHAPAILTSKRQLPLAIGCAPKRAWKLLGRAAPICLG
jgi:hypothetical protein